MQWTPHSEISTPFMCCFIHNTHWFWHISTPRSYTLQFNAQHRQINQRWHSLTHSYYIRNAKKYFEIDDYFLFKPSKYIQRIISGQWPTFSMILKDYFRIISWRPYNSKVLLCSFFFNFFNNCIGFLFFFIQDSNVSISVLSITSDRFWNEFEYFPRIFRIKWIQISIEMTGENQ